jgi:AMP-binding enzyme
MDPTIGREARRAAREIPAHHRDRSSSFVEMAARSDQLAISLATTAVAQRDRVMAMLGNHVALWKSMLAVTKVRAVIMPATTALEPNDLTDQIGREAVRHAIANADQVDKFADITGDFDRTGWPTQWPLRHGSPRGKRLALRHTDNWDSSRLSVESFWLCMDTTSRPSGYRGPSPAECGASFCGPRNQLCDNCFAELTTRRIGIRCRGRGPAASATAAAAWRGGRTGVARPPVAVGSAPYSTRAQQITRGNR